MKKEGIMKKQRHVQRGDRMPISASHEKKVIGEQVLHEICNTSQVDCIFCNILRESRKDETFITRLEFGSLFLHRNQNYLGRCIYVSNIHVDNFPHIDYELYVNLNREMLLICREIKKIFQPDLVNFASLGNTIRHFHYHIIPRYNHDSNWGKPPWPSGERKLAKEDLEELISTIRTSLGELDG